jgi:hypothetical protein
LTKVAVASSSGVSSPLEARSWIRPGCGRIAMFGGLPACVSMTICCS